MKFSYQARTRQGEVQTGLVEASSREAALGVLQKYGLYVTYLESVKEPFWQRRMELLNKVSKGDIVFFTRQLAVLLRSSIPVVESIETIARQTRKQNFKEMILKIAEEVEGGGTLSQAFSNNRKSFSPFFIGMIKSGETSGTVPESLDYLADYLEREQDFMDKITVALIYPIFVLIVFLGVVVVMGVVVVPRFKEIFVGVESELPFITRALLNSSDFLKQWWLVFVLLGLSFLVGLATFLASEKTKKMLDQVFLDLPIIGSFLKKYYLTRIALNLSTLISGGVPILQALEITGDVVDNSVYKLAISKTAEGVKSGQSLSSVLSNYSEIFPPLFIQMTVVGERTGHLENTLKNIVTLYEKEVDRTLDSLIKMIEPLMIILLGGLVAILAFALFVPLFEKGLTV